MLLFVQILNDSKKECIYTIMSVHTKRFLVGIERRPAAINNERTPAY